MPVGQEEVRHLQIRAPPHRSAGGAVGAVLGGNGMTGAGIPVLGPLGNRHGCPRAHPARVSPAPRRAAGSAGSRPDVSILGRRPAASAGRQAAGEPVPTGQMLQVRDGAWPSSLRFGKPPRRHARADSRSAPAWRPRPRCRAGARRLRRVTLPAITIVQPRSTRTISHPKKAASNPPTIIAKARARRAMIMPSPSYANQSFQGKAMLL